MESGFSRAGQTLNAVRPNENPCTIVNRALEEEEFECTPCGKNVFAISEGIAHEEEGREMCVKKKIMGPCREEWEKH